MLDTPFTEPVAWTLIQSTWQIFLVACVFIIGRQTLFCRSVAWSYAIGCLGLLAMVIVPIIFLATHSKMTSEFATPRLLSAIVLVWLFGVSVFTLRLLLGLHAARQFRCVGRADVPTATVAIVKRLCERMQIRQTIEVAETNSLDVPAVVGGLKPLILLPTWTIRELTPQQLEAVIAHELAHIRRHDSLVNFIQTLIETILFYHPAVWWLSNLVRQERENCCDDIALEICEDRVIYAKAIVVIAESQRTIPRPLLAASSGEWHKRIGRWLGRVVLFLLLLTPAICSNADEPIDVARPRPTEPHIYLACGDVAGPGKVIQLNLQGKRISDVEFRNCPYGIAWNTDRIIAAVPGAGEVVEINRHGKIQVVFAAGHPIDVTVRERRVIFCDNVANSILMSSGMTGDKQSRQISSVFRKSSMQSISVALSHDEHVVVGTDAPRGIFRFKVNAGADIGKPLLPADGKVAADPTSARWAACQPQKLHLFDGPREEHSLAYPAETKPYRNGIVTFGPDGELFVALKAKEELQLFRVDLDTEAFHLLFRWKHERLVDFAVGRQMDWVP